MSDIYATEMLLEDTQISATLTQLVTPDSPEETMTGWGSWWPLLSHKMFSRIVKEWDEKGKEGTERDWGMGKTVEVV